MSEDNFFKKYKFPEESYNLPFDDHGWFPSWNKELLLPLVKNKKLVLEIGSWLGKSTREWLNNSDAHIICVDTWEGSIEHNKDDPRVINLYNQFLVNQREWGNRISMMRMTSVKALLELQKYPEIQPDFIYIDASHQYEDVYLDLSLCYNAYPNATICGDDWGWHNKTQNKRKTVQEAVKEFCKNYSLKYYANKWAWRLL
jgi:predicted O-methyltransferase YrrM